MNGYTTYPSAFMVINPDGVYSKHYYAGSQRIVSKLGNATAALFDTSYTSCSSCPSNNGNSRLAAAANKKADNKTLQQAQMNDLQQYADLAEKGKVAYKEYSPNLLEDQEKALADDQAKQDPNNTTARMAQAQTPPPAAMYYYHPDHLGTSTFLTDANGVAYQFFLNLPFGETMAEQLGNSYYKSPYKFNGKELDQETGLYYYGARYYDPKTSIWLSIDPMAEEYPSYSPYNYCLNNPVVLIDPDGNSPISVFAKMLVKVGVKKAIKEFAENQIQKRLKNYMSKEFKKQFAKDLGDIMDGLDSEWWEIAIELLPGVGDVYGTSKFAIKMKKAYDKLQDLENKYVEKIYEALPKEAREKFKKAMRSKGVSDAKKDQNGGFRDHVDEETYVKTSKGDPIENRIEGHHKNSVKESPGEMSDPRNIEFKTHNDHKEIHKEKR